MLKIGDRIIVSNEAVRITRPLGSSKFVARYDTEDCDEYEAVFLGWVTVYAGTFNWATTSNADAAQTRMGAC